MLTFIKRLFSARKSVLPLPKAPAGQAIQAGNLIDDFFQATVDRKRDLAYATMTSNACLHEADHLLMAELNNIPVDYVSLPNYHDFFKEAGGTPHVAPTDAIRSTDLSRQVAFYLGGIFGELNIYDDGALASPNSICAFTSGCAGDLRQVLYYIDNDRAAVKQMIDLADRLRSTLLLSQNGTDELRFLQSFDCLSLSHFQTFRVHSMRHRAIATELYERWRANNFRQYQESNPRF